MNRALLSALFVGSLAAAPAARAQAFDGACGDATRSDALGSFLESLHAIWNPFGGQWCSAGSGGEAGWLKREAPPKADASSEFQSVLSDVRAGRNQLPADAKSYVYLFVGGLMTNTYPGYGDANLARLEALGLDARRVPVDTQQSVAVNAEVVAKAIADAARGGKQIVIMGHSKGGVDIGAALALHPELAPSIRSFISMQTPFAGSPIASDIQGCPRLQSLVDKVFPGLFHGNPDAVFDLSYAARRAFIAAHPIPAGIPILALASSRDDAGSITKLTADYVKSRYGLLADGLVVADDAEIPGSTVVRVGDMDHAETAMDGPLSHYHPADVTEALVTLALRTR